ncbi:hypothetical protein PHYSODRAFT_252048 [Phytophthora sojae]|uniref:Macro domain-containing protein n=1 Tax=Phytophthora sojae (strain P6497) TaxID=1094619 RepID=G5ABJ5_PHYSP|nr:hypothetical protein PHYSODRAFT_252048 [Phytophthora sojae]EGZ06720.1 hypothetical protein PHYSODRAFT_252048 [Phytophthora sojae]|eukprot:XP_009537484.1 hypothetical protein PHYSODRAFT_252048 [Phytophthora sojae]
MQTKASEPISLWKGDITTLKATAIVNAANAELLGCFRPSHKCIDNVIQARVCERAHEEPVGYAQITPGFALPADYVVHTVGPQLHRGSMPTATEREQLQSCYTRSLDLLLMTLDKEPRERVSIAFPCISTGLIAFPNELAVSLAVDSVMEWLVAHREQTKGWKVIFNTFLKLDYDEYKAYIEKNSRGCVGGARVVIQDADYLLVSAGAGLSASAGLDFRSEAVMKMFHPTVRRAIPGFRTLYNFIAFRDWDEALMWGFYFKNASMIWFDWMRYRTIQDIVDQFERREEGSSFVQTTNVDGLFQQEGFDRKSVFVMQGDFGRILCAKPCSQESVWDIKPFMDKGLKSFNPATYRIEDPADLPKCPKCGGRTSAFLREDDTFIDSGVAEDRARYEQWLDRVMEQVQDYGKKLVILEVGIGFNTPGVLRIPDEQFALQDGVQLVRVNQESPDIPFQCHGVEVPEDATDVLDYIAHQSKVDELLVSADQNEIRRELSRILPSRRQELALRKTR